MKEGEYSLSQVYFTRIRRWMESWTSPPEMVRLGDGTDKCIICLNDRFSIPEIYPFLSFFMGENKLTDYPMIKAKESKLTAIKNVT